MTLLDIIFILILTVFCARGFFHGILKEIAGIAGLLIGFWVANQYHSQLTPYVAPYMSSPATAETASYIITMVLVTIATWLLINIFSGLLKLALLAWVDHAMGGAFGFIKGMLLCAIILLALTTFIPNSAYVQESVTAPYIGRVTIFLSSLLPTDMKGTFNDGVEKLRTIKMPSVSMPNIKLPDMMPGKSSDEASDESSDESAGGSEAQTHN